MRIAQDEGKWRSILGMSKWERDECQLTLVRLVPLAASLIVRTVFVNQPADEGLFIASASLGNDVKRRSWRDKSWFSHTASVNASFFSASSFSTWTKRSLMGEKRSSLSESSSAVASWLERDDEMRFWHDGQHWSWIRVTPRYWRNELFSETRLYLNAFDGLDVFVLLRI